MRAMVAAIDRWRPDLYVDIHVTDGSDYQYDITFGWNAASRSPQSARWLDSTLRPALHNELHAMGHIPGPLIGDDPSKGLTMADRKSTRLNSSHQIISYAVFCLK